MTAGLSSPDGLDRVSQRRVPSARRYVMAGPAALALFLLFTGCSGEEAAREYATPRSLCGTPIDTKALEPFLPPGREISVTGSDGSGIKSCKVVIEGALVIVTMQAWIAEGKSTAYFAAGQTLDRPDRSLEGDRILYSGNQGFGKTRTCVDTKYGQELYASVQAEGSKHEDADAMKRIILAYIEEVERSDECTGGAL
ncbi:hypothetical protein ACIQNG_37420 [Streptomyces sp. NPDC091377]|uniref:hypothetical protein n=1 Tax=Streptomyces sp. NPDC091377 TaxID=3365995 RepID=UPI00380CA9C8